MTVKCHTGRNQTHMFSLTAFSVDLIVPSSITFEMCSAQLMVTDAAADCFSDWIFDSFILYSLPHSTFILGIFEVFSIASVEPSSQIHTHQVIKRKPTSADGSADYLLCNHWQISNRFGY